MWDLDALRSVDHIHTRNAPHFYGVMYRVLYVISALLAPWVLQGWTRKRVHCLSMVADGLHLYHTHRSSISSPT